MTSASKTPPTPTIFQRTAPLITAIEIENFKGIGHPMRVDFRPITLLFGRNSAGKSTVLHALCYANEILTGHLNPHTTALGGDDLNLGGIHQFVHNHDVTRTIRLRFTLNLHDWTIHNTLNERLVSDELIDDDLEPEWWRNYDLSSRVESGWLELQIRLRPDQTPVVNYELGLNDRLVGRLVSRTATRTELEFNYVHPLLYFASSPDTPSTSSSSHDDVRLTVVEAFSFLPIRDWDDYLNFNADTLEENREIDIEGNGSTTFYQFRTLVSAMFVGVGHALMSELGDMRYIGPLRDPYPYSQGTASSTTSDEWANGTAAWDLLRRHTPLSGPTGHNLVQDASDWLSRTDRLDTGYKLRLRSFVTIPTDVDRIVKELQEYAEACRQQGTPGSLDHDRLADDAAQSVVSLLAGRFHPGHDLIKMLITHDLPMMGATDSFDFTEFVDILNDSSESTDGMSDRLATSLVQLVKQHRQRITRLTQTAETLDDVGFSDVSGLLSAISQAVPRQELEILTADSGLLVRTSDIGVGVSQLLPVVVATLDPGRPSLTAIEQPELHIHPRVQVELGDLFMAGLDGRTTFLLETHSEHLMLRLLRRIQDTTSGDLPADRPPLNASDVSVIFFEQQDGETRVTSLPIDETGEFTKRWPHGFFEERHNELF